MDAHVVIAAEASSLFSTYASMWDQLLLPAIFFISMLLGFVITLRPRERAAQTVR